MNKVSDYQKRIHQINKDVIKDIKEGIKALKANEITFTNGVLLPQTEESYDGNDFSPNIQSVDKDGRIITELSFGDKYEDTLNDQCLDVLLEILKRIEDGHVEVNEEEEETAN